MPNEKLIAEIENLLSTVISLGGENERSQVVPNLTVVNANPTGLDGFVIVSDDRDGDNITAKKVGSVIYANNDKVNVMFLEGTEAIAFQQGSGSSNNGIWEIVPSTTTDIFYDKGDVGIGKTVAPDARLEILDTAQAQLRLTFEEDTKFTTFTVGTSHDLTIDPSSTGLIKLNATVTVIDEIQHEGDSDNKIGFTNDVQTFTVGGEVLLTLTEAGQDIVKIGDGGDVDINFNDSMFLQGSTDRLGVGTTVPSTLVETADAGNDGLTIASYSTTATFAGQSLLTFLKSHNATPGTLTTTVDTERLGTMTVQGVDSNNAKRSTAGFRVTQNGAAGVGDVPSDMALVAANNRVVIKMDANMDVTIANNTNPTVGAQLHVDQTSASGAQSVILLDQADVDEPFTKYVGSAAAANLTRSIVDDGDVTTATLVGWTKIEIDDVGNQVADGDYFQPFYTLA